MLITIIIFKILIFYFFLLFCSIFFLLDKLRVIYLDSILETVLKLGIYYCYSFSPIEAIHRIGQLCGFPQHGVLREIILVSGNGKFLRFKSISFELRAKAKNKLPLIILKIGNNFSRTSQCLIRSYLRIKSYSNTTEICLILNDILI